jgi:cold shock protein
VRRTGRKIPFRDGIQRRHLLPRLGAPPGTTTRGSRRATRCARKAAPAYCPRCQPRRSGLLCRPRSSTGTRSPTLSWLAPPFAAGRRLSRFGRTTMAAEIVKWLNWQKDDGFIQLKEGSQDVLVDVSAVERSDIGNLHEGASSSNAALVEDLGGRFDASLTDRGRRP